MIYFAAEKRSVKLELKLNSEQKLMCFSSSQNCSKPNVASRFSSLSFYFVFLFKAKPVSNGERVLSSYNAFETSKKLQMFSSSCCLSNHNKTANCEQVLGLQIMQSLSSHSKFKEAKTATNICLAKRFLSKHKRF